MGVSGESAYVKMRESYGDTSSRMTIRSRGAGGASFIRGVLGKRGGESPILGPPEKIWAADFTIPTDRGRTRPQRPNCPAVCAVPGREGAVRRGQFVTTALAGAHRRSADPIRGH